MLQTAIDLRWALYILYKNTNNRIIRTNFLTNNQWLQLIYLGDILYIIYPAIIKLQS